MKYQIENTISGIIIGVYEADSADLALDAMARDAGYSDYAEAQAAAPAAEGELIVTEV
uniref:hypothetical protein n=1 Tax=Castellaniella defragrans TaxID=75697 RepID=UPI00334265C5